MTEVAPAAEAGAPSPRATRLLLAVCFFVSGGAGLVYEVLWSRHLHALFGSTTESVAAVLAVFMTGLGLGGHLLGKVADRSPSPMRLYGILEVGVGLFALVTPALLGLARLCWGALAPHLSATGAAGITVKLLLAALVLVPPATLMGGTLPALVRATAERGEVARAQVGLLYALNTLGAVAGTVASGFVLVEVLGLSSSMRLTAVVNIGIGALVMARAGRHRKPAPLPEAPGPGGRAEQSTLRTLLSTGRGRYAVAGLFLSGAVTMVYEVVFTRVLGLVFGVSSYAFTLVLAVFLCGLGLGALLAQRIARARTPRPSDFGASQVAMAAVAALAMVLVPAVPRLLLYARQVPELSFGAVLAIKATLAVCALLPLATVAGLGTPLLLAALTADEDVRRAGRLVGDGYMINTAGTLLGSLATGFVLVERLGTQGTLRLACLLAAVLGLVGLLLGGAGLWRRLVPAGAAVAVVLLSLLASRWPPHTFLFSDSRAHRISQTRLQLEQRLRISPAEVLFFTEGREATIGVLTSGERTLVVNGHPDASDRTDMSTQLLAALVPLAVHPAPRDVMVVGFGSGVTADGAARSQGVEHVDVIELEQAVLDASPSFHHVNHAVEKSPKVRMIRDDGRSFAATTASRYDVIISEPSNPWRAGVASLFTTDFYRSATRALKPGGIFAQWVQLYALDEATLRLILHTLLGSFPEVQLWSIDTNNVVVVASTDRRSIAPERIGAIFAPDGPFGEELRRFAHVDEAQQAWGRFLLDTEGAGAFVAAGAPGGDAAELPVHTDDLPLLEFEAPRALFAPDANNHLRLLAAGLSRNARPSLVGGAAVPEGPRWAGIAALYRDSGELPEARAAIDRALAAERSPRHLLAAAAMALEVADAGRSEALLDEARGALDGGATDPGGRLRTELLTDTARLRARQRRFDEALRAFDEAGQRAGVLDGRLGVERLALLAQLHRGDEAAAQADRTLAAARPGAEVEALEVEQVYLNLVNLARGGQLDPARASAIVEAYPVDGLPRFPREKALATLAALARRPEAVIAHAQAALSGGAVDAALLELWARALAALGRLEEAATVERQRAALVPEAAPLPSPLLQRTPPAPAAPATP